MRTLSVFMTPVPFSLASRPDPARRNEHSRQAILAAAIALIGERGYEQVSIEAIAQRGGVGKQTIYRWWPSKGAVILEALARRVEEITPLPFPDSSNVVEDLRFQMLGLVQILNSPEFRAAYQVSSLCSHFAVMRWSPLAIEGAAPLLGVNEVSERGSGRAFGLTRRVAEVDVVSPRW